VGGGLAKALGAQLGRAIFWITLPSGLDDPLNVESGLLEAKDARPEPDGITWQAIALVEKYRILVRRRRQAGAMAKATRPRKILPSHEASAKTKILDAALAVICAKAYAATTVDETCAASDVTGGTA
jgi:hypothetical protein